MQAPLLEVSSVSVDFEGLRALNDVSLSLAAGEILGLIGPNGAGKTTLMNVVSGEQRPSSGIVCFDGRNVGSWTPHKRASAGLSRTFQGVRLFDGLTVAENVEVGAVGLGLPRKTAQERSWGLLKQMNLTGVAFSRAGDLPQGDARRLGLARAAAMRPRCLLLDEPAAGLNEEETDELGRAIRELGAQRSLGVLVIEHDMRLIMNLCERIQVLNFGMTIFVGTAEDVMNEPAVIEAYLGTRKDR